MAAGLCEWLAVDCERPAPRALPLCPTHPPTPAHAHPPARSAWTDGAENHTPGTGEWAGGSLARCA